MTVRKSSEMSLPQYREPATCAACGETFTCGAAQGACWCTELKLSEAALARLRLRYSGCLCRPCLERFAPAEAKSAERSGLGS
ncbi:MAG TPA: cysteine-rich CWC family protein [Pyrinomonadaceae bacterium]|jgi:hypothetical protein